MYVRVGVLAVIALIAVTPVGCGESDTDGDGIADSQDRYPRNEDKVDGDRDGWVDVYDLHPDGSDVRDSDNDRIADAYDLHPNGEDRKDTDGDGYPDPYDRAPHQPRYVPPPSATPRPLAPGVASVTPAPGPTVAPPASVTTPEPSSDRDNDGISDGRDLYPDISEYSDPDHDGVITRDDGRPTDPYNDTDRDGRDNWSDHSPTNDLEQ